MAPPQFKVIIAGGGIVGLALGVMLERAGIDYLILEAVNEVRPLGAVLYVGPAVLRAFEQLGLLDDMVRHSNIMTGVTLLDQKLNQICRIGTAYARDRYGYDTITIVRPKLYDILLSRIPAYKILFNKRVRATAQNSEGVKVRCEDGSTYNGDILVAADGGSSSIRKAIYEEIRKRSKKVSHPVDYARPKLDQRCIVGVSEPLSVKQYPVLASKNCELMLIMPKDSNCTIWFVPMAERRFGWGITSPLPCTDPDAQPTSSSKSKSNLENYPTFDSDSFEAPNSPSSIHEASRSFSALSNTSYSPPSITSSSSGQQVYGENDYNFSTSTNNVSSISNINNNNNSISSDNLNSNNYFTPQSVRKRQSFGRLSKHSTSSNGSQTRSEYTSVIQLNDSSALDLKDLPRDRIWGKLDEQYHIEEAIREQASPFGGTLGDIIDATSRKMISMVVVEEKFYHTWHFGRTVLLGDACHKLLPSSGHATTQGILDAISLASLLAELPSNTPNDINALFRVHYQRRGPSAKAAVVVSQQQAQMLFNRKLTGKIMRKMASNWISDWFKIKLTDRLFESRPMLPYLKPIPDRGSHKDKDKSVPLLQDKRFEMARRKSVSSGYLSATSMIGEGRDGGFGGDGVELDFAMSPFSTSMPSIVMQSSPLPPPVSGIIEDDMYGSSSRSGEKEAISRWRLYRN
ncbi:hypothetical protein BCR41DRAFT_355000 [Lobosporangium transversale]|uniref:FAD-binding domain-containing protein n=1 Tax=Lobosporangium transversale TaxID=64571 RepID=A0A1Y2GLU8_9FUNG|nr:hypothetical protein BCR41DRAFT_355000 [Lobosporangium transversale]ORZ13791.1 hypothetical protein BCR41DRAFT_355000 [Lobosporangium transversale]|eukprot:XP_021880575.1 hypothetical protein BCR41DRAFT_355000 [Lobosporangium transversale]